jgi:hypothetical protein
LADVLCLAGVTLRCVTRDEAVFEFIVSMLAVLRVFLRSRGDTALEVLALRQQVVVLKRKRPRPVLNSLDRFFWTTLRRFWPRGKRPPRDREAGDRRRLAPRRLPALLALAFSASRWTSTDQ